MKKTLVGLALALALTSTQVMAMNPWKTLLAAMVSASLVGGFAQQQECPVDCEWQPEFESFRDYLEGLTTCEMETLFPAMEMRHEYLAKTAAALAKHGIVDSITRAEAIQRMRDIAESYTIELKVLNNELLKTQELLFDDCTSKESKEILAKHASILIDAIERYHGNLQEARGYLDKA